MATTPTATRPVTSFDRFNNVLREAVKKGGSDLHVVVGSGFRIRLKGEMVSPSDPAPLTPADVATIAAGILLAGRKCTRETVASFVQGITDFDCSYSLAEVGRFRVNICSQRGSLSLVLRHIPFNVPDFTKLGLPEVLEKIAMMDRGLVLLTGTTGTTGSGKSSTLAALINHINQNRSAKIITIEDPIEFIYRDSKANIIQREVGSDTESFAKALRAALRQDPDIILVGEMRDTVTIDIAMKAAETGHLVFSTVHTTDAPKTVSRLIAVFDPGEQPTVRLRLAESCRASFRSACCPRPITAAGGGLRNHAPDQIHSGVYRRPGQDRHNERLHGKGSRDVRHADLRPAPDGSLPVGNHLAGRGHACRHQPGRLRAKPAIPVIGGLAPQGSSRLLLR